MNFKSSLIILTIIQFLLYFAYIISHLLVWGVYTTVIPPYHLYFMGINSVVGRFSIFILNPLIFIHLIINIIITFNENFKNDKKINDNLLFLLDFGILLIFILNLFIFDATPPIIEFFCINSFYYIDLLLLPFYIWLILAISYMISIFLFDLQYSKKKRDE